jgi:hypothetical protein
MASAYAMRYEWGRTSCFFFFLIGDTCFYTMRRGLSEGYDGREYSGYDYRETDK